MSKKLNINEEFNNINIIMINIQEKIKKYTELNPANNCLKNKSLEDIILYNIKKHSLSLNEDMKYFKMVLKTLGCLIFRIEKIILLINEKIISIIDKQNKNIYNLNKLSTYNNNYQILYTNIKKCIKNIKNIRMYYIYTLELMDNNITQNNIIETDLGKNIHKKYWNKYYNRHETLN